MPIIKLCGEFPHYHYYLLLDKKLDCLLACRHSWHILAAFFTSLWCFYTKRGICSFAICFNGFNIRSNQTAVASQCCSFDVKLCVLLRCCALSFARYNTLLLLVGKSMYCVASVLLFVLSFAICSLLDCDLCIPFYHSICLVHFSHTLHTLSVSLCFSFLLCFA